VIYMDCSSNNILSKFQFYELYRRFRIKRKNQKKFRNWLKNGKPLPPPHIVKQLAIKEYAKRFRLTSFIETGTYQGEMIDAVKGTFDKIFSIELEKKLCEEACRKFDRYEHITILQGDSGEKLIEVLSQLNQPGLFWLDGHYSGGETAKGELDTPIMKELDSIYRHPLAKEHIILIDDARCFNGEGDYPGIAALENSAKSAGFDCFEVKDDIIRFFRTR
jgi:hypothetical protein